MYIADQKGGENWLKTSRGRRQMGFKEVRLDAYSVHGPGSETINVLDMFDPKDPMIVANCRMLANSLVPRSTGDHQYFSDSARELLTAVLLFVVTHAPPHLRHLNFVRHILSNLAVLKETFDAMTKSRDQGGIIAEFGSRFKHIPEREFGSILSTTMMALSFLQDPLVSEHVERSSFDIRATTRNTTTYMILPISLMSSHAPILRLYLIAFTLAKKEEGLGEQDEVMFLIDEAGALGDLEPLENAIHAGRGVGIRVFLAFQAIKQVDMCFPGSRGEAIIAGTDMKIVIGANDYTTAKLVSDMAGEETINLVSGNEGASTNGGGLSTPANFGSSHGYNQAPGKRPLVSPDVVMRSPGTAYIFTAGNDPILASPVKYDEDEAFAGVEGNRPLSKLSLPSLIIAGLGVSLALYFGLGAAKDTLPSFTRFAPRMERHPAPRRVPEASSDDDGGVSNVVFEGAARHPAPAPAAPQWPAEATCPRCKSVFNLPDGYDGRLLKCEDCPTEFIVHKTMR